VGDTTGMLAFILRRNMRRHGVRFNADLRRDTWR
jgi:hypothetical protein